MTPPALRKKRLNAFLLALLVVVLGIVSRTFPLGFSLWDKYLGDALYAVLIYLGLTFLFPDRSIKWRAWTSMISVSAIEAFQLTGIPSQLYQSENTPLRLIAIALGTHFSWLDVLAYAAGIATTAFLEFRFSKTPINQ